MYDNKVRLSQDVLEKAEMIASEWGLKNARAAIEAVFRRYSDDYLYGREPSAPAPRSVNVVPIASRQKSSTPVLEEKDQCEALDVLDDLLAM